MDCTRSLGCKCPLCDASAAPHDACTPAGADDDDPRCVVAAINYVAGREYGSKYDPTGNPQVDGGKLGSVYTSVAEHLMAGPADTAENDNSGWRRDAVSRVLKEGGVWSVQLPPRFHLRPASTFCSGRRRGRASTPAAWAGGPKGAPNENGRLRGIVGTPRTQTDLPRHTPGQAAALSFLRAHCSLHRLAPVTLSAQI